MSSIDDRVVVDFVQSLGPPSSSGVAGTSTAPDKVSRRELLARIDAEEAILSAEGRPWYEIKASLLQESDKALIRDLSGIVWYCDMSWSEKPTRRVPPPPAQEYDPTPFIRDACTKCFNARDLVREDLLCHFGFSRKGVAVEGDLAYKKQGSKYSRGSNPRTEERANPTPEEPTNPLSEEPANPPPVEHTKEKRKKSSSGSDKHSKRKKTSPSVEVNKEAGTSQPDLELDAPVLSSASDKTVTEALASKFLQALVWGGELSRRVTKAREVARSSRRSLDDVMAKHDKLMKEIEDVRGASDAEKKSLEQKLSASEASITRLQEEMKKAGEEAEEKIKKVQEEAEASWEKRKEDFLKSDEFDRLCATRALSFFQKGFDGLWKTCPMRVKWSLLKMMYPL
ncbi:far upstream element-binding protein 2-like [Dorcoceras hygrometricum]|uniref:Far upstream element-binding protein 2-like n=1 Tax=Dorcoceras hygrometricum TaxID=472368 RepID=A0A2Z7BZP1_9LAMI|nr:far upstream element-binding protein 2-like [Dorcoceras hygrometricum]